MDRLALQRFIISHPYRCGICLGAVVLLLMGAFGTFQSMGIPAGADIALVILLIAALLWISETVPLFVTSFAVLFLCLVWLQPSLSATGAEVSSTTFLAPFFSDVILLFLGGFTLSAALHKYRLDELLARWIIARTGDSIPKLLAGIMGITAVLSMWLSNTATAAMMLTLVLPITQQIPVARKRARQGVILAIPIAANVGGIGTPIGTPPNAIALQYLGSINAAPSFTTWMMIGIPLVLLLLAIGWLLLIKLIDARGTLAVEKPEVEPVQFSWTPQIGIILGAAGLTIGGWVTSQWHDLSSGTIAMIPILAYFGSGILDGRDLKTLSWDVLFLMGGGLCMGAAISSSGLAEFVVERLPVEGAQIYVVMVLFGVVACVMSSVMSNTATANLMMPIILGLSMAEPLTPILLGVAFACSIAMPLPISTPPNAMAFSSGLLSVPDMFKPGIILTMLGLVLIFTLGYLWWNLVGLV